MGFRLAARAARTYPRSPWRGGRRRAGDGRRPDRRGARRRAELPPRGGGGLRARPRRQPPDDDAAGDSEVARARRAHRARHRACGILLRSRQQFHGLAGQSAALPAAGASDMCAVRATGEVVCWGGRSATGPSICGRPQSSWRCRRAACHGAAGVTLSRSVTTPCDPLTSTAPRHCAPAADRKTERRMACALPELPGGTRRFDVLAGSQACLIPRSKFNGGDL